MKLKHYEILFLVHPDQSEQVPPMIERYTKIVAERGGTVHRTEDWGRMQLAYPINKLHKAHFVLMNVECNQESLKRITDSFRYNDSILRNLVLRRKTAITAPSYIMTRRKEENGYGYRRNRFDSYSSRYNNSYSGRNSYRGNSDGNSNSDNYTQQDSDQPVTSDSDDKENADK